MTPLPIPVFTSLRPAPPAPRSVFHRRLVAAVRWDYEVGLMSQADLVRKYRLVISSAVVREIANGQYQSDVPAARCALAWCKRSWRLENGK